MKKFIIWAVSILSFIGVCAILCFTLFALNAVFVDFKSSPFLYNEENHQEIIESGEFSSGASVFFINKKINQEKIEKTYPYIKVINIETIFPNKMVVHCIEREELFAVNFEQSKYYICDEDFKILRILDIGDDNALYESTQNSPILVEGCGEIDTSLNAGDFLNLEPEFEKVLKKLSPAFKLNNRTCAEQKAIIKNVELLMYASIKYDDYTVALKLIDFLDFETTIIDASDFLELKINLFLAVNAEILDADKENSELTIYQKLSGEFVAHKNIKN